MKFTYHPKKDDLKAISVGAAILYRAPITVLGEQLFKGELVGTEMF